MSVASGAVASDISLEREARIFAICESVAGVLEEPTDDDQVLTIGTASAVQNQEQLTDEQRRDTRSRLSPIRGRLQPGEWSVSTYLKPSGALGVVPEIDPFLIGAFGEYTQGAGNPTLPAPGSGFSYTLGKVLPSLSVWFDFGHTVKAIRGASVNQASFTIQADAITQGAYNGQFMEEYWAGTSALSAYSAIGPGDTSIQVDDARLYTPNVLVQLEDEVIRLSSDPDDFDYTNNTLNNVTRGAKATVAAAHAAGTPVTPWLPTGVELGEPVHGKFGTILVDGELQVFRQANITINNNIRYLDDEINGTLTAEQYLLSTNRDVSISSSQYWRAGATAQFFQARRLVEQGFSMQIGSEVGNRLRFELPNAIPASPQVGGGDEKTLEVEYTAVADTGSFDEELVLTLD